MNQALIVRNARKIKMFVISAHVESLTFLAEFWQCEMRKVIFFVLEFLDSWVYWTNCSN